MKFQYDIHNLIENHNYQATDQYNGLTGKRGRQMVTVVEAAAVPTNWNGDKRIVARATVEGSRGARYSASIYSNGFVSVVS